MLKKYQKLPIKNLKNKSKLIFNVFGLKALETGEVTINQILIIRKLLAPFIRKRVKFVWRIFPRYYKTNKSFGSRMGSGKGAITTNFCKIRPGHILLEFSSLLYKPPIVILKKIQSKLNVKSIFIFKSL